MRTKDCSPFCQMMNKWLQSKRLHKAMKSLLPLGEKIPTPMIRLLEFWESIVSAEMIQERYRRELLKWLLSRLLYDYLDAPLNRGGISKEDLYSAIAIQVQYLGYTENLPPNAVIKNLQDVRFLQSLKLKPVWIEIIADFATGIGTPAQYQLTYRLRGLEVLTSAIEYAVIHHEDSEAYFDKLAERIKEKLPQYMDAPQEVDEVVKFLSAPKAETKQHDANSYLNFITTSLDGQNLAIFWRKLFAYLFWGGGEMTKGERLRELIPVIIISTGLGSYGFYQWQSNATASMQATVWALVLFLVLIYLKLLR